MFIGLLADKVIEISNLELMMDLVEVIKIFSL